MAKRLTRAKGKIRSAGIPFRVPPDHDLTTSPAERRFLARRVGEITAASEPPAKGT